MFLGSDREWIKQVRDGAKSHDVAAVNAWPHECAVVVYHVCRNDQGMAVSVCGQPRLHATTGQQDMACLRDSEASVLRVTRSATQNGEIRYCSPIVTAREKLLRRIPSEQPGNRGP